MVDGGLSLSDALDANEWREKGYPNGERFKCDARVEPGKVRDAAERSDRRSDHCPAFVIPDWSTRRRSCSERTSPAAASPCSPC